MMFWRFGYSLALGLLLGLGEKALVQAQPATPPDSTLVYYDVEQMPQLPDGRSYIAAFLAGRQALELFAEVPETAAEGHVFVGCTVGPSGVVSGMRIIKGLDRTCDSAALAEVAKLPRFVPGRQHGQPVAVGLTIAVLCAGPYFIYSAGQVLRDAKFPAPGLQAYLAKNLRLPTVVKQENLSGCVLVSFIVGADGRVHNVEIKEHLCTSCDQEALRLVKAMPAWVPARNARGRPVPMYEQVLLAMPKKNGCDDPVQMNPVKLIDN